MSKISITRFVEGNHKIIVALFFILFFFVGLSIFMDYGLSYDEARNRNFGLATYDEIFIGKEVPEMYRSHERTHGPVFELVLVFIEKALNLQEIRDIFLMRHLATFLMFYVGVFFFYLLCKHVFRDWKIGLLGCLSLVLSPRLFAHSFYNSVDIAFLSLFIISMYTLVKYLDKKNLFRACVHALTCGILIGIRVVGIVVPFFTFIFAVADLARRRAKKQPAKKIVGCLLAYLFLLFFFSILFWPFLWESPVNNFILGLKETAHDPIHWTVLYFGRYVKASELPWHYSPVWLAISTPPLYILFFFVGLFVAIKSLLGSSAKFCISKRNSLIILLWFFLPLVSVAAIGASLFDGWRHLFFVYPAFLMIYLAGLLYLFKFIKAKFHGRCCKVVSAVFILVVVFGFVDTAQFMVKYHPLQNVYFNALAGRDMQEVKNNFELDYFGLSYRPALEYILRNDQREKIKISTAGWPGKLNSVILPPEERKRLVYVKQKEAEYFLSNYRWHKEEYSFKEYYSIKIGGAEIVTVYKLKE